MHFVNRVLRGNITAIGPDGFTRIPDKQQTPVAIANNHAQLVHENPSAGAALAIVLGIAGAVALLAVVRKNSDTARGDF